MILESILDTYMMGTGDDRDFMWVEMTLPSEFFPSLISSTRGTFLVTRHQHPGGMIRVGVFSPKGPLDTHLPALMDRALQFSKSDGFKNIFSDPSEAFHHVRSRSEEETCPRYLLVPEKWTAKKISTFFGKNNISTEDKLDIGDPVTWYSKTCKVLPAEVTYPVFVSKPDFVGVMNVFANGSRSILLHNVSNSLAFVVPSKTKL